MLQILMILHKEKIHILHICVYKWIYHHKSLSENGTNTNFRMSQYLISLFCFNDSSTGAEQLHSFV